MTVIQHNFDCNSQSSHKNELTTNIEVSDKKYEYHKNRGFQKNGGYIFYLKPDEMQDKFNELKQNGVLNNEVVCLAIEFLQVNLVEETYFAYTNLLTAYDGAGFIKEKSINTKAIYNPSIQSFIGKYMIGVTELLNILFLILLLSEILVFIVQLFYITFKIEYQIYIFDVPYIEMMSNKFWNDFISSNNSDFETIMQSISFASNILSNCVQTFFSLTTIIICIKLVYNLTYYKDFQNIFYAFQNIFIDMVYLVLLLVGFLTAFTFQTYYYLGTKDQNFAEVYKCFVVLTEFIYTISLSDLIFGSHSIFYIFAFLVLYMIIIRFLILTLFYATAYLAYFQIRKSVLNENFQPTSILQQQNENIKIGLKEFYDISKNYYFGNKEIQDRNITKLIKVENQSNQHELLFEKIKKTVNTYQPNLPIQTWADLCAQDIQYEFDQREKMLQIENKIYQEHLKLQQNYSEYNNEKDNQEQIREEQLLRLKLWDYYRGFSIYQQKINLYFQIQCQRLRQQIDHPIMNSDEEINNQLVFQYIKNLEYQLQKQLKYIKEIKQYQYQLNKEQQKSDQYYQVLKLRNDQHINQVIQSPATSFGKDSYRAFTFQGNQSNDQKSMGYDIRDIQQLNKKDI